MGDIVPALKEKGKSTKGSQMSNTKELQANDDYFHNNFYNWAYHTPSLLLVHMRVSLTRF